MCGELVDYNEFKEKPGSGGVHFLEGKGGSKEVEGSGEVLGG